MPTQYPGLLNKRTYRGVTFDPKSDGSIVLNGTSDNGISYFLFANEAEGNGTEGLRLEPGSYVSGGDFDNAKVLIKTSKDVRINGGFSISAEDDYHDIGYVVYIYIPKGTQFDNTVLHPYLLKGEDVPAEIPPYSCTYVGIERLYFDTNIWDKPYFSEWFGYGNEAIYNRVVWSDSGQASYIFAIKENRDVSPPEVLLIEPPKEYTIVYTNEYIDNIIKVEGGGKITALNEHKLPVPFTVIYQKDPYYTEGGEA